MTKIIVLIPTYNRKDHLSYLLEDLSKQKTSELFCIDILVVIDGSTDGTIEMIKAKYSKVKMVFGDGNLWYTKSINMGFKALENNPPDLVLILNDDTRLPRDYIENLYKSFLKYDKHTIVGSISITYEKPYRVFFSGVKRNILGDKSLIPFLKKIDLQSISGLYPSRTLPGRGALIPWEAIKALNYFDEKFRQYGSDMDFIRRAAKKNYNILISWEAKVFCHYKLTSSTTSFLKPIFNKYLASFFDPYSSNYLMNGIRYYWRHEIKALFFYYILINLLSNLKNYIKQKMKK